MLKGSAVPYLTVTFLLPCPRLHVYGTFALASLSQDLESCIWMVCTNTPKGRCHGTWQVLGELQRSNHNEPCYSFLALVTYIIVFYTTASVSFAATSARSRVCQPFSMLWHEPPNYICRMRTNGFIPFGDLCKVRAPGFDGPWHWT